MSIVDRLGGVAADTWGKFKNKRAWQDASDNYRNSMRRLYLTIRILGKSEPVDLEDIIVRQFEICNFPDAKPFIEYLLQTGRAIVLFDGLDEVSEMERRRSEITNLIQNFSKQHFLTQCLVTCRIAANEYAFEQFQD